MLNISTAVIVSDIWPASLCLRTNYRLADMDKYNSMTFEWDIHKVNKQNKSYYLKAILQCAIKISNKLNKVSFCYDITLLSFVVVAGTICAFFKEMSC